MNDYSPVFEGLRLVVDKINTETVGKLPYKGEIPEFPWESSPKNPFSEGEAGRIYYVQDGESIVLSKKGIIRLTAGNVYLFPPNSIIATRCDKFMYHTYIHFFEEDSLDFFNIFSYLDKYEADSETETLFETIKKSVSLETPADFFKAKAAFYRLLCPFLSEKQKPNTNVIKFSKVLRFIDANLDKELSLDVLAQTANYNPTYFSNFFRKTFGVSPIKYVANKRIFLAKSLLLNTYFSVGEIAVKCGYADIFSFSRFFRLNTGYYPTEYKKLFSEDNLLQ